MKAKVSLEDQTVRIDFEGLIVEIQPTDAGEVEVRASNHSGRVRGEQIVMRPVVSNTIRLAFVRSEKPLQS